VNELVAEVCQYLCGRIDVDYDRTPLVAILVWLNCVESDAGTRLEETVQIVCSLGTTLVGEFSGCDTSEPDLVRLVVRALVVVHTSVYNSIDCVSIVGV